MNKISSTKINNRITDHGTYKLEHKRNNYNINHASPDCPRKRNDNLNAWEEPIARYPHSTNAFTFTVHGQFKSNRLGLLLSGDNLT